MKIKQRQNIESVVKEGLCTGCGTCAAICPNEAIEHTIDKKRGIYLPGINEEKCNNCGICYQICPGWEVNFKQLNTEIFGKEPTDILIGNYLNCYLGHSLDDDIRYNSASGGLVSQLLIFALEERIIDGALVTKMKKDNPLEPEPFIARTREEIIEASKSKYCPVPVNIALKQILNSKEEERFAVVGLPCHIHGIRKTEQINKKLKERIILFLGILCNHAPNFWGTELLLRRLKVKREEVIRLDYRGEGRPGYMKISRKNGELRLLLPDYWSFLGSGFFTPSRCLMCPDQTAELADISFGDAWLPELEDDKMGQSMIISRTEFGEQLLQKARDKILVELNQVTANEAERSQMMTLFFKKKVLGARLKLFQGKPSFNVNLFKSDLTDYLLSLFPYFNHRISQNRALRLLLGHIPAKFLTLYRMPFNTIYNRKFQGFRSKFLEPIPKRKSIKIVITNDGSWLNRGNAALLHSRVNTLREFIHDAEFTVFTFQPRVKKSLRGVKIREVISVFGFSRKQLYRMPRTIFLILRCGLWLFLHKYFHLDIKILRSGEKLDEYYNADAIISTGGDTLGEFFGTLDFLSYVVNLLFGLLLDKPVVIYAESIGPFKRWWNRAIARYLLNRCKLITLREEISHRYVKEIGINKTPIYVTADSAFNLESSSVQRVKEILEKEGIGEQDWPLIGITISGLISRYGFPSLRAYEDKYRRYNEIMAQLIDHLVKDLNAIVVLIPHATGPDSDDRVAAADACKLVKNKQRVVSIKGEYTPEETKGIIGQCDLFIGARMHATIASTSMGVPTVAIAYSHKYHGIIGEMLGYEQYVLDVRKNFNSDDLIRVVDDVWKNRVKIRKELESKMEDIKKRALLNAKLVKELIEYERGGWESV